MLVLLSDWDETITAQDTLALIAPPSNPNGPSFAELGAAYVHDLKEHDRTYVPPSQRNLRTEHAEHAEQAKPTTTYGPLNTTVLEDVLDHLSSLDQVELASQTRVEQSGLFRGMPRADLDQRAHRVPFRQGWTQVAHWLQERTDAQLHIISVGWSARFIGTALGLPAGGAISLCSISANEVQMGMDGAGGEWHGTGKLTKSLPPTPSGTSTLPGRSGVRIASDKRRELDRILATIPTPAISVYAGDSLTDLEALLSVDVGLLLGETTKLRNKLDNMFSEPVVWTPQRWKEQGYPLSTCTGWKWWLRDQVPTNGPLKVLIHTPTWREALPVLQRLYAMAKVL